MDKPRQRRSSGPRSFNRDDAIDTAMRMFWRHGYEGVSIADLTSAIGIAPPSLYAAFGSKAGLYIEALDRYDAIPGALAGMDSAISLEQAVAGLLDAAIRAISSAERGCMISTGFLEGAAEHHELTQELADRRRRLRDAIAAALRPWLERSASEQLAAYLIVVQQGLSVQARDGATAEEMRMVATQVVAGVRARDLSGRKQLNGHDVSEAETPPRMTDSESPPSYDECEHTDQPPFGPVVHRANRMFTRMLDAELRQLGVTSAQLAPLIIIARSVRPMLQRDLVKQSAIAQPAMVAAINLLARNGFITQRKHDQDGRATILELTDRGRAVVSQAHPILTRCNARAVAGLSPEQETELVRMTELVISNIVGSPEPS